MNLISSNLTSNDQTTENSITVSTTVFVILLIVSGIPALTNMSYIFVCFRMFSTDFNKLLILCLCLSGSMLGFSTVWYSILEIFRSFLLTPLSCSISIFLVNFGLFLSYSFILVLNLASYLTIRSRNFGIKQKLNRIRLPLFSGVILCSLSISCSTWLIPHNSMIKTCDPPSLFGEHLDTFLTIFSGTLSILLSVSVITSILIILQIYYIFFNTKKSGPRSVVFRTNQIDTEIIDEFKPNRSISRRKSNSQASSATQINVWIVGDNQTETNDTVDGVELNEHAQKPSLNDNVRKLINTNNDTTSDLQEASVEGRKFHNDKNEQNISVEGQSFEQNIGHASHQHIAKPILKSWEKKAVITNLIITFTTVLLTGPFIGISFAIIALDKTPLEAGFITFILFNLNSAISPFIFVWRIPELRQKMKHICKQN